MPGYLTGAGKRAVLNGALVLLSVAALAAISEAKRAEQVVRPPEGMVRAECGERSAESIAGVCDFGGCQVATTEEISAVVKDILTTEHVSESYTLPATVWFPEEEPEEPVWEATRTEVTAAEVYYSPEYFCKMGLIDWGGWTWSWYSEKVLPGGGLNIPGRYTAGGYVRDGDGHICLASDVLAPGTVIDTPFGSAGKVYDDGVGNDYTIDVYVGW